VGRWPIRMTSVRPRLLRPGSVVGGPGRDRPANQGFEI